MNLDSWEADNACIATGRTCSDTCCRRVRSGALGPRAGRTGSPGWVSAASTEGGGRAGWSTPDTDLEPTCLKQIVKMFNTCISSMFVNVVKQQQF